MNMGMVLSGYEDSSEKTSLASRLAAADGDFNTAKPMTPAMAIEKDIGIPMTKRSRRITTPIIPTKNGLMVPPFLSQPG
jgi:hypothetical protein